MGGGLIVHCPSCGAALMVTPTVNQFLVHKYTVSVDFHRLTIDHECEK